MKKFLLGLVVFVILIAAVVALLPMLVPASAYKSKIETAASEAFGRDVTFGDDLSFKIFPQAAFRVSDLEIANAEGFDGPYLAKIKQADIGVKIAPLLSRNVEINRFVLEEPDLILTKRKDGAVNWAIGGGGSEATGGDGGAPQNVVRELSLGDVRIANGRATYTDETAGQTFRLTDMNLKARLESLEKPLTLDGDLKFQDAPASADIVITTLGAMMRNEEAKMLIELTLADASAGADLNILTGDAVSWRGPITINAPDLPALARLFDVALEEAPGFDNLALDGQAVGGPTKIALSGAEITFDKINADGDLTLDWSGAKPKAVGAISTSLLDLRPYMPPPAETSGGFPAWSEAKMDFTSLRNIDANLDIAADKILLNAMKIDRSQMKLTIANGRMVADIPEIAMYGGAGSGRLVVNARSATPSFSGNFDLGAVQAQPLSLDMLKTDRLLGIGQMKINFTAAGASQAAIMNSIDGDGGFDLADGAIKGLNIAKMARAAASLQGGLNPAALASVITEARGDDQTTDFSKFLCNFDIKNGLMTLPTINLDGPYLTMTGSGTINLPAQTIDLRLSPRASTSVDGTEGRSIAIPLRVGGTFSKPSYGLDAESLVKDRVESGVRDLIGGALGGGDSENGEDEDPASAVLKGLIGGRGAPKEEGAETADEPTAEEEIANEAINLIFGGSRKKDQEKQEEEPDPQN
ncbi:MAG: AsmA family protein [Pseudomonadota bacterium]